MHYSVINLKFQSQNSLFINLIISVRIFHVNWNLILVKLYHYFNFSSNFMKDIEDSSVFIWFNIIPIGPGALCLYIFYDFSLKCSLFIPLIAILIEIIAFFGHLCYHLSNPNPLIWGYSFPGYSYWGLILLIHLKWELGFVVSDL